jgi:hypothetical protein
VDNGTIQVQGWSASDNPPYTYAVPTSDYVVMPSGKLTSDSAAMQSYVVEMDYERADNIGDTGTVAFLTRVSQLLQNPSSLGANVVNGGTQTRIETGSGKLVDVVSQTQMILYPRPQGER